MHFCIECVCARARVPVFVILCNSVSMTHALTVRLCSTCVRIWRTEEEVVEAEIAWSSAMSKDDATNSFVSVCACLRASCVRFIKDIWVNIKSPIKPTWSIIRNKSMRVCMHCFVKTLLSVQICTHTVLAAQVHIVAASSSPQPRVIRIDLIEHNIDTPPGQICILPSH